MALTEIAFFPFIAVVVVLLRISDHPASRSALFLCSNIAFLFIFVSQGLALAPHAMFLLAIAM
ncbi:MAG: hypothetical protein R3D67_08620 [Hyphomicrobiaceae bacterium]